MNTALKLKINPFLEYLQLIIHPIKPLKGLFFLIKSRESVPLNKKLIWSGIGKNFFTIL
jgi:hypothetical protein